MNCALDGKSTILIQFESFSQHSIAELQYTLHHELYMYPTASRLIECLDFFHASDRDNALTILEELSKELDNTPHFLKKIICVLYAGLLLSPKYSIGTKSSYLYVSTYLQTSFPGYDFIPASASDSDLELFKRLNYHQDSEQPETGENKKYDIQYGYLSLINEYNLFILHNDLNAELLVNPQENINSFLSAFFINLDALPSSEDNYETQCSKALKGLITKLKKANIPSVDYSLLDLKSSFMLRTLGLYQFSTEKKYEGTEAILRFLALPPIQRNTILQVCSSIINAK